MCVVKDLKSTHLGLGTSLSPDRPHCAVRPESRDLETRVFCVGPRGGAAGRLEMPPGPETPFTTQRCSEGVGDRAGVSQAPRAHSGPGLHEPVSQQGACPAQRTARGGLRVFIADTSRGLPGPPMGSGEGCAGFLLASHWGLSHAGSSCPFLLEVLDHIHVAVFLAGTSR